MIRYVLFDLDGTLLYTLDTIAYHLNATISDLGLGAVSRDDTRRFIGNGARKLVARALAKNGIDDDGVISRVLELYNSSYDNDPLPLTHPYDGVKELVDVLCEMGITLGVVTNKPEPTAKKLVDSFFPGRFSFVRGGKEGIALKPDPEESLSLLHQHGGTAAECAFVGDSDVDVHTGRNIGAALTVGVSWGFRSKEELVSLGADVVCDSAAEVLEAVLKYSR